MHLGICAYLLSQSDNQGPLGNLLHATEIFLQSGLFPSAAKRRIAARDWPWLHQRCNLGRAPPEIHVISLLRVLRIPRPASETVGPRRPPSALLASCFAFIVALHQSLMLLLALFYLHLLFC